MTTLATDDFAGTGALSGSWTVDEGAAARVTGELSISNAFFVNNGRYTGVSAPNDQWAQFKMGSAVDSTSDEGCGPIIRSSGTDFYLLQGNAVETRIYKRIGGTYTQLGSDGPAVAPGDVLYLEAQGTQLIAKKNSSTICGSPTDSARSSGGFGFWGAPLVGSDTLDDFAAGDFAGGAFPPVPSAFLPNNPLAHPCTRM